MQKLLLSFFILIPILDYCMNHKEYSTSKEYPSQSTNSLLPYNTLPHKSFLRYKNARNFITLTTIFNESPLAINIEYSMNGTTLEPNILIGEKLKFTDNQDFLMESPRGNIVIKKDRSTLTINSTCYQLIEKISQLPSNVNIGAIESEQPFFHKLYGGEPIIDNSRKHKKRTHSYQPYQTKLILPKVYKNGNTFDHSGELPLKNQPNYNNNNNIINCHHNNSINAQSNFDETKLQELIQKFHEFSNWFKNNPVKK